MLARLLSYFEQYGYWVVFLGVMLENAGIPVPGETILLAAGFFAEQGKFNLWEVMAIAAAGAVLGDNAGYYIGHKIGRATLERYGKYIGLTPHRISHMERYFESHGDKTILVARFITGLRVFAALLAGSSRMQWRTFAIFNMLGAVLWSFGFVFLGYFAGERWRSVFDLLRRRLPLIAVVVIAVVAAAALFITSRKNTSA